MKDSYPTPRDTVEYAKTWVYRHLNDKNVLHHCPCCDQPIKMYSRSLNKAMATTLIWMCKLSPFEFMHTAELPCDSHEVSQLVWWDLVEEELVRRPDGGRAGFWRPTKKGRDFAKSLIRVPSHAQVYNARLYRLVPKKMITIKEAFKDPFDYRKLMDGL